MSGIPIPEARIKHIIKTLDMACRGGDLDERLCADIDYLEKRIKKYEEYAEKSIKSIPWGIRDPDLQEKHDNWYG
jgi:hypothetical protein